jgi:hypothetical protein
MPNFLVFSFKRDRMRASNGQNIDAIGGRIHRELFAKHPSQQYSSGT